MKSLTCALILALSCITRGEEMLADITSPVTTPFGVYHPRLVDIIPRAPTCDPGENLEQIINLDRFSFSGSEIGLLKDNHFFVAPARQDQIGYNEMFDIYNECRESGIPQFITTDAMLHGFHLMFDYILRSCEEERFIAQLNDLLEQLQAVSAAQYERATDERVRQAIFRNRDYLLVASQLLSPKMFFVDPLPGGKYNQELTLIYAADAQLVHSPIFHYPEDFTQYKPRGHYTKSDSLQRYFRAMMWLGRMTFSCEDDSDYAMDMTLSAILLTQAIAQVRVRDVAGLDIWENIYQPTVFFVGKSDDIQFAQYLPICHDLYGEGFSSYHPDTFTDMTKLANFLQATRQFPEAAIGYPGQPRKGFRFMGQRFVPDSWILDELVYDKVPFRLMPTGLDVMIVLGPRGAAIDERAFQYLSERDKSDQSYVTKLDSLKFVFRQYPDDTWAQNAYWNWLYCFMPLIMPKGEGYPFFMQTDAWRDKELYAALASWAELRHDTILYVKQSGTERGLPPTAVERQGYVEANPHFYARIASLADFLRTGLASRDLLLSNFATHIKLYAELAAQLQNIAEKELTDSPLSSDDYLTIFEFGKTLYDIVTFQDEMPSEGPQPGSMESIDPMPVIADVHYDSNSGTVLEEGVGYPYAIYVICDIEGQPTIAKGAGFSYYEFTQPATNRLTDEQWRDMLKKATNPPPPDWTGSFCLNHAGSASAEFYVWSKPATVGIKHDHIEKWRKGDPLAFRFSVYDPLHIPKLIIELADGQEIPLPVEHDAEQGSWKVLAETASWPLGKTVISISSGTGENRLDYRTHFKLEKATDAEKESARADYFGLLQNYPNPFNSQTFIKIKVPKSAYISLEVFDIRGRRVKTLVASTQPAGLYVVPWDGTDDAGQIVSSGIYYYRMATAGFSDIKRLILLR